MRNKAINPLLQVHLDYARGMDKSDALAKYRNQFFLPEGIYMDGNSLGLASKPASDAAEAALDEWRRLGIGGWLDAKPAWFDYPELLGSLMAGLMGAQEDEVVMAASTTVNLHALVSTFYKPSGKRRRILADSLNFPSDLYALAGQCALLGESSDDLLLAPSADGRTISEDTLIDLMDDTVALVLLPGVLYRSGQLLDIARLTAAAHDRGIVIGFDCCHSAGAVPHKLDEWDVDFALWCSYKYLNGGPGSPAFLYVNRRHFEKTPALPGWFGFKKTSQFNMETRFNHQRSAAGWNMGSPHILSAAALFGSLRMFHEAGMNALRAKSLAMTSFMARMIDDVLIPYGFACGTPMEESRRGGHICLEHGDAVRICKALRSQNIIPDYRPPNVVRLAPIALYNTFEELVLVIQAIMDIMASGDLSKFDSERETVS